MSSDKKLDEVVAQLTEQLNDLAKQHKADIADLTTRIEDLENAVESLAASNSKVDSKWDESKGSVFIKLVNDAKLKGSGKRAAFQYLEYHAAKVIEMKDFVNLEASSLTTYLKSDVLRVKETLLLDAVIRWGRAECKRQAAAGTSKLDSSKDEDVAQVLVNLLPLVRVHTMTIQEIISQREVLTAAFGMTKVLNLFTYVGLSKEKRAEMASQFLEFAAGPRKGTVGPVVFTACNNTYCTLSNENKTASTTNTTWNCNAIASKPDLVDDWMSYKLLINSGGGNLMIGWGPSTMSLTSSTYSSSGWYFYQAGGTLYSQNGDGGKSYASSFSSGSTVTASYSPSKGQIKFAVDGSDKGVAYNNISGDLVPAINFYQTTSVTISAAST